MGKFGQAACGGAVGGAVPVQQMKIESADVLTGAVRERQALQQPGPNRVHVTRGYGPARRGEHGETDGCCAALAACVCCCWLCHAIGDDAA
jgi:hypothetical protein